MKKIYATLSIMICVLSSLILGIQSAWGALVTFSPTNANVTLGDVISVAVIASDLGTDDLGTFDLTIAYDPAILTFDHYALGGGLGDIGLGEAVDSSPGDVGGGKINLVEVSLLLDLSFQPDPVTLATLWFEGNSPGVSPLSLSNVVLGNEFGDPATPVLENGTVNVVPVPGTILLFVSGFVALAGLRRKVKR